MRLQSFNVIIDLCVMKTSAHPSTMYIHFILSRAMGEREPTPAVLGQGVGYTLDRSPVRHSVARNKVMNKLINEWKQSNTQNPPVTAAVGAFSPIVPGKQPLLIFRKCTQFSVNYQRTALQQPSSPLYGEEKKEKND